MKTSSASSSEYPISGQRLLHVPDNGAAESQDNSSAPKRALTPGDRIRSLLVGRPGSVVKVYADGSACVCRDDGDPQAEGLGHERVPRELLEIVDAPHSSSADAVAGREARAAAELDRFLLQGGSSAPIAGAGIEKRKAYCAALLKTLMRYADEADLGELEQALEEQVTEVSGSRAVPGLVAARYDLFCRFWIQGGAK